MCRVTQLASGRAGAGAMSPDPVSHRYDSSSGRPSSFPNVVFWTNLSLPASLEVCSALPPGS